jgi:Family of unknown function (DUF7033)
MEGSLTLNQRNYILYHLAFSVDISPKIRSQFVFGSQQKGKICFLENNNTFDESGVINVNNCPILFPGDPTADIYTLVDGTLVFHHDLLKSAFYLLSGYQEYGSKEKDALGRFPYEGSIQNKLGIIHRPLVNEYFNLIHQGISAYCRQHNIPYKKPEIFDSTKLFLTHDVDRIDKYTFHTVKGKLKNFHIKSALQWFFRWINPFYRNNPYWSYDFLESTEKNRAATSTYFFLNRGVKHIDSYYSFREKRIKNLIGRIEASGSEIGLHGGVQTATDIDKMRHDLNELNDVAKNTIIGNRQHRLLFDLPRTMINLEKCGIVYDSTLGFAAHEGFRNSYCYPFKLYDFEDDKMINVWEIPLIVMDVTLMTYRKLDFENAQNKIILLIDEINKHKGILTMLIHPESLDEEEHPGIKNFYEKFLDTALARGLKNINAKQIIESMEKADIRP